MNQQEDALQSQALIKYTDTLSYTFIFIPLHLGFILPLHCFPLSGSKDHFTGRTTQHMAVFGKSFGDFFLLHHFVHLRIIIIC